MRAFGGCYSETVNKLLKIYFLILVTNNIYYKSITNKSSKLSWWFALKNLAVTINY